MSDLRCSVRKAIVGIAGAIAIAACVPRASKAQSAQSAAQYRTRLLATLRARKVTMDTLDTLRARRVMDLPPDSLVTGVVRVRYSKLNVGTDLDATLRAAVQHTAAIADAQFGDARLEGPEAVIVVKRIQRTDVGAFSFDMVQVELPGSTGRITTIRAPITQRKLSDEMLQMIGTLATNGVPANVTKWAGFWAPSSPLTGDDWEAAALDLTTSTSSVSRTCYSGSLSGCESALGLTAVHDPLVDWYTPEGWRALVSTWDPPVGDLGLVAAHEECVEKKVMATCERLARMRQVPVPLNMSTRSTLFNLALARGGRSAYTRLRNAKGTPLEVLSTVAGVSADSLVDEWRARTLAAVPHAARPSAGETTVLVAWTLLFGFAATRRRPWR